MSVEEEILANVRMRAMLEEFEKISMKINFSKKLRVIGKKHGPKLPIGPVRSDAHRELIVYGKKHGPVLNRKVQAQSPLFRWQRDRAHNSAAFKKLKSKTAGLDRRKDGTLSDKEVAALTSAGLPGIGSLMAKKGRRLGTFGGSLLGGAAGSSPGLGLLIASGGKKGLGLAYTGGAAGRYFGAKAGYEAADRKRKREFRDQLDEYKKRKK